MTAPGTQDDPGRGAVVAAIMACHFIAAFAALGMPPFFALILAGSLDSDAVWLAGWLYIVPTFFTALSSPWWGRLADRYGKKRLLLRAQLGLAASFVLAGSAASVPAFAAALVLQGLLGGTFSASNAYLATVVSGPALMRSLTLMQWSARAALFVAPAALGLALPLVDHPLALYRWLALLPLAAALCIWRLPSSAQPAAPAVRNAAVAGTASAATAGQLYALQWLFVFGTVLTFPYFVPWLHGGGAATIGQASLLFGLPHLVYLACALPLNAWLSRWMGTPRLLHTLACAFALLAGALVAQAWAGGAAGWPALAAWRVLMGVAMTAAYLALHGLIAAMVGSGNAGRTFGWFESSAKWGAVAAGAGAGALVQAAGMRAPFIAGGAAMVAAACYTAWIASSQFHMNNRSRHANE